MHSPEQSAQSHARLTASHAPLDQSQRDQAIPAPGYQPGIRRRLQKSALDFSPRALESQPGINAFIQALGTGSRYATDPFSCALIAVLPLMRIGYSLDNLAALLTHLKTKPLKKALNQAQESGCDLVLNCPIHFAVSEPQYHYLCIPGDLQKNWQRLLRSCIKSSDTQASEGWLLKGGKGAQKLEDRFKGIKRELRRAFQRMRDAYRHEKDESLPKKLTLNQFNRVLANQAMLVLGIEPAWVTLRQTTPLPVNATPNSYPLLRGLMLAPITQQVWQSLDSLKDDKPASATHARLREYITERQEDHRGLYQDAIARQEKRDAPDKATQAEETLSATLLASNTPAAQPANYISSCKTALDAYFKMLFKYQSSKRLSPKQAQAFLEGVLDFLWHHELELQPYSLTMLSLCWITELLCESKLNPLTAQKYISQLTRRTGIYYEMSHDLRLWSDDELEEFLHFIDERLQCAGSTRQSRARQIVRFFRFCGSLGLMQDVGIPKLSNGYITTRKRNSLIAPERIKRFIETCSIHSSADYHASTCGTALAYYGGLRHDEFARLRLSHLHRYGSIYREGEFGEGPIEKLRIKITRGKTANAPRSVYLHLFIPEPVQTILLNAIEQRRERFPTAYPKNIRLTGKHSDRLGYRSKSLKHSLVHQLKQQFGHNVDAHTLRHNFATWLILAYQLAKYPELAAEFNIPGDMPLFEAQWLKALMNFVRLNAGGTDSKDQPQHFSVLAKLIGHGDIQTTFQHYFHGHCVVTRYDLRGLDE